MSELAMNTVQSQDVLKAVIRNARNAAFDQKMPQVAQQFGRAASILQHMMADYSRIPEALDKALAPAVESVNIDRHSQIVVDLDDAHIRMRQGIDVVHSLRQFVPSIMTPTAANDVDDTLYEIESSLRASFQTTKAARNAGMFSRAASALQTLRPLAAGKLN